MARRILIRAGRPPHDSTTNEAAFAWGPWGHFAGNAGNMVFSDSVYESLNTVDAEITCDAYIPERTDVSQHEADEISERYDVYVIPLANAFRNDFGDGPLQRLTSFIEKLKIPVVVTGVGGQGAIGAGAEALLPNVQENIKRFMRAVLARSASVGLRGASTRTMLVELGFSEPDIDVIGCPSLFRMGRDFKVEKRVDHLTVDSPIAINLESELQIAAEFYSANEQKYSDLVSVFQTIHGAELLLWGTEMPASFARGTPCSVTDRAYREGKIRFFTSPRSWRSFLSERHFSFGTRIHGNITAVAAGTPSFVLTTDLRTEELAKYHGIPHAEFRQTISSGKYLAEELYDATDYSEFNRLMPGNWDHYFGFLERNGLHHIHQAGKSNLEYTELLRTLPEVPPLTPISAADVPGISSRLNWLWQGRNADRMRPVGSFIPAFELDATDTRSAQQKLDWVNGQLRQLRDKTEKISDQLEQMEVLREQLSLSLGQKVRSGFVRGLGRLRRKHD